MAQPSSTAPGPDTSWPTIPISFRLPWLSLRALLPGQIPIQTLQPWKPLQSFQSLWQQHLEPTDGYIGVTNRPAPLPRSFGSNISNQPMDTSASQTVPAPEPENDENAASGQTVPLRSLKTTKTLLLPLT
ncbi:hypothetical protein BJ912DRAFT_1063551 [Pholiota molesta]|nr:hypothetical protein BJ912DRAFT_1063551 [Pholiota molesta]